MSILQELTRRNVFRVATAYKVAASWAGLCMALGLSVGQLVGQVAQVNSSPLDFLEAE